MGGTVIVVETKTETSEQVKKYLESIDGKLASGDTSSIPYTTKIVRSDDDSLFLLAMEDA